MQCAVQTESQNFIGYAGAKGNKNKMQCVFCTRLSQFWRSLQGVNCQEATDSLAGMNSCAILHCLSFKVIATHQSFVNGDLRASTRPIAVQRALHRCCLGILVMGDHLDLQHQFLVSRPPTRLRRTYDAHETCIIPYKALHLSPSNPMTQSTLLVPVNLRNSSHSVQQHHVETEIPRVTYNCKARERTV